MFFAIARLVHGCCAIDHLIGTSHVAAAAAQHSVCGGAATV
jgi:hypothetical protein